MTRSKLEPRRSAEGLLIRARRGDLPAEQQVLLRAALDSSASLRLAYQVGRDFDYVQRVQAGDDELIVRACERVLRRPSSSRNTRSVALALLSAALLLGATGAAASGWLGRWQAEPEQVNERSASPQTQQTASRRGQAAHASAPEQQSEAKTAKVMTIGTEHEASAPQPARETPPGPAQSMPASNPPAARSAASMFRQANAARRNGDFRVAKAIYAELQAVFPNTTEARISRVSLGKLHLSAGRAHQAERQFRLYLTTGGGHLNEEALVGRAEALARLGNTDEELRVWGQLRSQHPGSLYAARAGKRIQELNMGELGKPHE